MGKNSLLFRIIIFIFLFNLTINPSLGYDYEKKLNFNDTIEATDLSAGEIIDVSFSNKNPTLGKPVDIIITFNGNPNGLRFSEILSISDEFEGLIFKSSSPEWKYGEVSLDPVEVIIGKLPKYKKKIKWYPVIAGNHTFIFKAGDFPEISKKIGVGFVCDNIIFPSIGSPSIINKNFTTDFTVVVSEERFTSDKNLKISDVQLKKINESYNYFLDNQIFNFSTYVSVGQDEVEDELIVRYDISEVPCGFYDIHVKTLKNEYIWPHAVLIIDKEPEDFKFVQLTDIHIDKVYNLINEGKILDSVFDYLNFEIQPDFIVISGDIVDWYNNRCLRNFFEEFKEVVKKSNSPVFLIPGNHERYANRLLFLYNPFNDLSSYNFYLNPINDYAFEYGGINFILLDSGYDYSRWEIKQNIFHPSPEGSGITNTQFYLIENEFGNNLLNQNIFMHHPVVNYNDDRGLFYVFDDLPSGNDQCIAFNRCKFIDYCLNNNVSLVISGHTHTTNALNFLGEDIVDSFDWPIFLQTDSTTLSENIIGGRLFSVESGEIKNYDYISLTYDSVFFK